MFLNEDYELNVEEYHLAVTRLNEQYKVPIKDINLAREYVKVLLTRVQRYMILDHSPFTKGTLHLYLLGKLPELDTQVMRWINTNCDTRFWDEEVKFAQQIDEGYVYLTEGQVVDHTNDPWSPAFKHTNFIGLWYVTNKQAALQIIQANKNKTIEELEKLLGNLVVNSD